MEWLEFISRVIHVLAAVCWIGGLYLLLRVVRPILLKDDHSELRNSILSEIQKKFRLLAGMMLLTLLVTGIINILFSVKHITEMTSTPILYMILLTLKLLLVGILIMIYLMNYVSMKKQSTPSTRPVFILPKTALSLGIIIIVLGIMLHSRLVGF